MKEYILLAHASTGFDLTSSIYRQGLFNLFSEAELEEACDVLHDANFSLESVQKAGNEIFSALYGVPPLLNLNELRFLQFRRLGSTVKIDVASLCPTLGAAKQHSLRVFSQIQSWLNREIHSLDWDWKKESDILFRVISDVLIPLILLKTSYCRCKEECGSHCGCRRKGTLIVIITKFIQSSI